MSTLQMLDVAIGIIFIFLLLSLICSAGSEVIEAIIKRRASDLHDGIKELLDGSGDEGKEGSLLQKFYKHPLVSSLFRGKYTGKFTSNLPSYIPSKNFALSLLDIISPASSSKLSGASGSSKEIQSNELADNSSLRSLSDLRDAVLNMQESNAKQAMLTLIDAAGNNINKLKENIETWYNSSMDRVAGWYKRRVQWILLVLGLLTAIAMNVDTIAILKSLMKDAPLRNSLVAATTEYAKANGSNDTAQSPQDRVERNISRLNDLRLPVGWYWNTDRQKKDSVTQQSSAYFTHYVNNADLAIPEKKFWPWFYKVLGWIITALAVSQGAAFWFDLLNKIMVIRTTVKPHEKSQEEGSEDRQNK